MCVCVVGGWGWWVGGYLGSDTTFLGGRVNENQDTFGGVQREKLVN